MEMKEILERLCELASRRCAPKAHAHRVGEKEKGMASSQGAQSIVERKRKKKVRPIRIKAIGKRSSQDGILNLSAVQ